MKKYISIIGMLLAIVACQDDDSIEKTGKPTINVVNKTTTVFEGESAIFDFNLDYAVNEPLSIRIELIDENGNVIPTSQPIGEAGSGNGYEAIDLEDIIVPYSTWFDSGYFSYGYLGGQGYVAEIPAYSSNFQLTFDTISDEIFDQTKTYRFRLSATSTMAAVINEVLTVNIENFIGDDLITRLNWDGDYLDSGASPCDADNALDLDLELYYEGVFANFSYSNCPEELIILGSDADGTYTIDASYWDHNGNTNATEMNIPVTIDFIKSGVFFETLDLSALFPLNAGGLNNNNGNAITSFTIEKSGTTYTITDSNNNQIAQGRFSDDYRISLEEKRKLK